MDNARAMRRFEAFSDFDGEVEHQNDRHRLVVHVALERLAFEEFHGDEVLAIFLTNVVYRADIRMIQRRGGAGLALEVLDCTRIICAFGREEFQSYDAVEPDVVSLHTPLPFHRYRWVRGLGSARWCGQSFDKNHVLSGHPRA